MQRFLVLIFFILVISTNSLAQDKTSVYVLEGKKQLLLKIDTVKALPIQFSTNLGRKITSYKLYEAKDTEELVAELKSKLKTANSSNSEQVLKEISEQLNQYEQDLLNSSVAPECGLDCARVKLTLSKEIAYGKTYVLKITGAKVNANKEPLVTKVFFELGAEPSAQILPSLDAFNRREVRVESKTPVKVDGEVKISQRTYTVGKDLKDLEEKLKEIPSIEEDKKSYPPNELTFELDKKLSAGQSYDLVIEQGLTDGTSPVTAKGVIAFPGLPSSAQSPKIDLAFSSFASVKQKPTFNLSGVLTPVRPTALGHSTWFFEPLLALDVGFGTTRSSNSIIVNSPFTHTWLISRAARPPAGSKIPVYAGWAKTPWYRLSNIKFYIGPKLEADRKFNRINLVGNTRLDFNFHKFVGLIKNKRTLLERNIPDKASFVEIHNGINIVPYVSFDFGRHITDETIRNDRKKLKTIIPSYNIFRTYLGVNTIIERKLLFQPVTFTLNGYIVHLAQTETIGFSNFDGIVLRRLKGFQPFMKASLIIPLDPTKHYNLVFNYENGRTSPNFEYLNKTSAGIKIVY